MTKTANTTSKISNNDAAAEVAKLQRVQERVQALRERAARLRFSDRKRAVELYDRAAAVEAKAGLPAISC